MMDDRAVQVAQSSTIMYRWIEVWLYVEDFNVPRWVEAWELEEEPRQPDLELGATLAAMRFAGAARMPTGRDFIAFVGDYFSLS